MNKNLRLILMILFSTSCLMSFAQRKTVSGLIVDDSGFTLPGVNVLEKGTSNGTVTDFNGIFSLEVADAKKPLVISYVGFTTQEVSIANKADVRITMLVDASNLQEVVVIGYGSMKKSDLTGSVASVSGEALLKVASNRPVEALQGRVAGLSVAKSSGRPGAGLKVRIRGVGSTNNSDPLYVVDGIPVGNDVEFLAPEDIESVEVLKDASATAIYGNRGAGGVIIITTKSGKPNSKPIFSFNTYTAFGEVPRKIDLLGATDHAKLIAEAADNDNQVLPADVNSRINYVIANNAKGTDWQNEVFKRSVVRNYNLSVRGGFSSSDVTDRQLTYSLGGTFFDEEGIVENTGFKKYILNSKTEYKFNSKFKLGLMFDVFRSESGGFSEGIYNGPIPLSLTSSPIDKPFNNRGEYLPMAVAFGNNPTLISDQLGGEENTTNYYRLRGWLEYEFVEGLSFKTNYIVSRGMNHTKKYSPSYFLNENFNRAQSELFEQRGEFYNWTMSNLLNYTKTFKDKHKVIGLLGQEYSYNFDSGFGGTGLDVPTDSNLQYFERAKSFNERLSSYNNQNGLNSYFARAFYSYDNKYMITGTVRYDGSSKFVGDNVWGVFPAFGVSWKADEESFIEDLDLFSTLKFRAGWGRVGNQGSAGNGSSIATIGNYSMQYVFNNQQIQGGTPTNIPTPELSWENIETQNFGVDLGFLAGDLSITADYFIKETKDMITQVSVPGYFAKDRPNLNIGTMKNRGLEVATSYRSNIGEVNIGFGANITLIDNEVTKLNNNDEAFLDGGFIDKLGSTTRTEKGREIAYFYGYQTNGILRTQEEVDAYNISVPNGNNAKIGDVRFVDNNGNGEIDADDRAYLGSAQGDYGYGFNFNIDYKGFDMSANFYGVQGVEIVNGMSLRLLGIQDNYNAYSDRINRFHPTNNPSGTQPRVTLSDPNNNLRFSDRYVEDGSFLRLKNLQIGYTIPADVTKKLNIDRLRFYVSGQNLITFTDYKGYDPEIGDLTHDAGNDVKSLGIGVDLGNYPQPRLYYFGVNVSF